MAEGVEVRMTGIDELVKTLEGLQYDIKKKGGRFALRKAAQVIRDQARQNAQTVDDSATPEMIAKNITERWNGRLNKRTGDLGFRVGVLGGARNYSAYGEIPTGKSAKANPGGDTFYWRFVEFGTSKTAARPFMRPAMEQSIQGATDAFIRHYQAALDRALRKTVKGS